VVRFVVSREEVCGSIDLLVRRSLAGVRGQDLMGQGSRFQDFRGQGSRFDGSGVKISWVRGQGFRVSEVGGQGSMGQVSEFRVANLEIGVQTSGQSLGFKVQGLGFRV